MRYANLVVIIALGLTACKSGSQTPKPQPHVTPGFALSAQEVNLQTGVAGQALTSSANDAGKGTATSTVDVQYTGSEPTLDKQNNLSLPAYLTIKPTTNSCSAGSYAHCKQYIISYTPSSIDGCDTDQVADFKQQAADGSVGLDHSLPIHASVPVLPLQIASSQPQADGDYDFGSKDTITFALQEKPSAIGLKYKKLAQISLQYGSSLITHDQLSADTMTKLEEGKFCNESFNINATNTNSSHWGRYDGQIVYADDNAQHEVPIAISFLLTPSAYALASGGNVYKHISAAQTAPSNNDWDSTPVASLSHKPAKDFIQFTVPRTVQDGSGQLGHVFVYSDKESAVDMLQYSYGTHKVDISLSGTVIASAVATDDASHQSEYAVFLVQSKNSSAPTSYSLFVMGSNGTALPQALFSLKGNNTLDSVINNKDMQGKLHMAVSIHHNSASTASNNNELINFLLAKDSASDVTGPNMVGVGSSAYDLSQQVNNDTAYTPAFKVFQFTSGGSICRFANFTKHGYSKRTSKTPPSYSEDSDNSKLIAISTSVSGAPDLAVLDPAHIQVSVSTMDNTVSILNADTSAFVGNSIALNGLLWANNPGSLSFACSDVEDDQPSESARDCYIASINGSNDSSSTKHNLYMAYLKHINLDPHSPPQSIHIIGQGYPNVLTQPGKAITINGETGDVLLVDSAGKLIFGKAKLSPQDGIYKLSYYFQIPQDSQLSNIQNIYTY